MTRPQVIAAILGGIVGIVTSIFGMLTNKHLLRYRLKAEHKNDEMKKLRRLISRYHGRALEAAVDWDRRMGQLYKNREGQWLNVDDPLNDSDEYVFRSYVFRFLALCAVARQFEAEAFYIDSRIAGKKDISFLVYAKSFLWVMTDSDLHKPFEDGMPGRDHFLNDQFRPLLDRCHESNGEFDFQRFEKLLEDGELDLSCRYFNGLRYDDIHIECDKDGNEVARMDRYRWDRLVALHLLVMAFINTIGYEWQQVDDERFEAAAREFKHPEIAHNLRRSIPEGGLRDDKEASRIVRTIEAIVPLPAPQVAPPTAEITDADTIIDIRDDVPAPS